MFIVQSYVVAVLLCVVTMLCWGSWANTQKLASKKWPFQLFYWDYSFGIFIVTLLLAFTLGSSGELGRAFLDDISQADGGPLGSAFWGGVIFNFANLLLVIAIDITGMAIAFPVGIGLALILGVLTNYLDNPTGDAMWLFLGVTLIAIAIILDALAYRQITNTNQKTPTKGIVIALLAGIAMGFFYKYVAQSLATDFENPEAGKLTPYTALVVFSAGILISNLIFNTWNMYKPISGEKTNYTAYLKDGSSRLHLVGILGGVIWGIGMSFSILASEKAGPAIAYGLGQGATMVAAFWGVFIWKEFENLEPHKKWMLWAMFLLFAVGLALIIYAR